MEYFNKHKLGGINIVVNKHIDDGTFYKSGKDIICDSNTAYGICFMNGVDDESIGAAMSIARQVLGTKS